MKETRTSLDPVRKRVRIACEVEHAFRTFTDGIGTWWPLHSHSISALPDGSDPPTAVVFEPRAGGRLYEVAKDGRECDWATILAYEPPHRIVLEWRVNPAAPPTEVEVGFAADGDGTVVELEHRGFERYAKDGEATRSSYDAGWPGVLRRFEESVLGGA